MTYADKIRNMTDGEIASLISSVFRDEDDNTLFVYGYTMFDDEESLLEFLQTEVAE